MRAGFYVFFHVNIGHFSAMFSLIFSCGVVFILGIAGEASHCRSVAGYAKEIATRKGLNNDLGNDTYHAGLHGDDIPLLARIVAVADYADRHIKQGEANNTVIENLLSLQGSQFDPEYTKVMIEILKREL